MARALLLALVLLPAVGNAQPLTLPLADVSKVLEGPKITYDWIDGANGDISFGSGAIGVSEDGTKIYISCNINNPRAGIAVLAIPQGGGRAKVVSPCSGLTQDDIKKIIPGWGAGAPTIGGVLEQGGRVCVTAFGSYDANGRAQASHWCGPSLTQLSGPFRGTVTPGFVHSQMGVVPPEWRATLGGPAFSTAGYTSITSRSDQGAGLSVFDPATVTADGFPMFRLLGCAYAVPKCASRWTKLGPSTDHFDGSELAGGTFIVPGTRTLVVIEREGVGGECYGYATTDKTLHGTPYPSPEGVRYCYAPYDPPNQKGNKAQSYRLVAKLYDLADLAAVKAGTKKPEDIDQYDTVTLPGSKPNEFVSGGAFNPVTGEFYLLRGIGGGINTIHVFTGWAPGTAPPPPPPTDQDCVGAWGPWTREAGSESACQAGVRSFREAQTFTVTTPASGNGAACPFPLTQTRVSTEACQMPASTVTCWVTGTGSQYADGDHRPTVRCDTGPGVRVPVGTTFTVTVPPGE